MGVPAATDDTLHASVATTFDVLAWEIELAGARCIFLDTVMGDMMKAMPADRQDEFREAVHTVDLLSQQLTSLSAFTRRMSGSVSADVSASVDRALEEITLGALADRMSTAFGGVEKGLGDGDDAGDLDLF